MSGPAVTSATHYQDAVVPRRAVFDDLRVGQWVAWCGSGAVESGKVDRREGDKWWVRDSHGDHFTVTEHECELGEVTILRDAPAPPVTVRREDYDALIAQIDRVVDDSVTKHTHPLVRAARALIDNAVTGDTP